MQIAERERPQQRPPQADRHSATVNLTRAFAARLIACPLTGLSGITCSPEHARPLSLGSYAPSLGAE